MKASTGTQPSDFRALELLRDKLGAAFTAGAVLYPGTQSFQAGDRIFLLPIDQLWQPRN